MSQRVATKCDSCKRDGLAHFVRIQIQQIVPALGQPEKYETQHICLECFTSIREELRKSLPFVRSLYTQQEWRKHIRPTKLEKTDDV